MSCVDAVRGIPVAGGMNGSGVGGTVPTSLSGQQLASAIPSPTVGKSWRSKSMNLKHSATSSMLASPTHSPSPSPFSQTMDSLQPHGSDGSKVGSAVGGGPQRSMLDKFRLINPRSARASPSVAEMALQEEDDLSEYGEDGLTPTGSVCSSGSSSATTKQMPTKTSASSLTAPSKNSSSSPSSSFSKGSANGGRSMASSKDKEDKSKSGKPSKDSTPPKEEREAFADSSKKTSKIASFIPKGGKQSSGKKDGSSGIPKPGLKAPSSTSAKSPSQSQTQSQAALNSSGNLRGGGEGERSKLTKGGQGGSFYTQRSMGGPEGKRTSMTSSTSTSALSGSSGMLVGGGGGGGGGGALGGNGVVQLPQQQQHNHPNTATVAPFMYRWVHSMTQRFYVNHCVSCSPGFRLRLENPDTGSYSSGVVIRPAVL